MTARNQGQRVDLTRDRGVNSLDDVTKNAKTPPDQERRTHSETESSWLDALISDNPACFATPFVGAGGVRSDRCGSRIQERAMSDVVPFGRYKGMPVEDMLADQGYMAWLECQPWFRAKFAHILKNRDVDAASRTPVHNRLQTLFLDDDYCVAFALTTNNNFFYNDTLNNIQKYINSSIIISRNFEYPHKIIGSCDVLLTITQLEHHNQKSFSIEIKPTVADEYPAVLRQMSRNNSEYLFVGEYTGEGATQDQFVKIFKESGKTVVFKKDVDAKLEEIRRAS